MIYLQMLLSSFPPSLSPSLSSPSLPPHLCLSLSISAKYHNHQDGKRTSVKSFPTEMSCNNHDLH